MDEQTRRIEKVIGKSELYLNALRQYGRETSEEIKISKWGKVDIEELAIAIAERIEVCPECKGKGNWNEEGGVSKCLTCQGRGWVVKEARVSEEAMDKIVDLIDKT